MLRVEGVEGRRVRICWYIGYVGMRKGGRRYGWFFVCIVWVFRKWWGSGGMIIFVGWGLVGLFF